MNLEAYCTDLARRARAAARALGTATGAAKNRWLLESRSAREKHVFAHGGQCPRPCERGHA